MRRINLLRAHGSPTCHQYRYYHCRCVSCTRAKAAYRSRYSEAHTQEAAEGWRRWYDENREAEIERERRNRKASPTSARARQHNYSARKRGAPGAHTSKDIIAQYERQRGRCYWGRKVNPQCTASLKNGYHVDHVVPVAGTRTSSNGPENLVLTCQNCNQRKHAKDPMDWAGVMF